MSRSTPEPPALSVAANAKNGRVRYQFVPGISAPSGVRGPSAMSDCGGVLSTFIVLMSARGDSLPSRSVLNAEMTWRPSCVTATVPAGHVIVVEPEPPLDPPAAAPQSLPASSTSTVSAPAL